MSNTFAYSIHDYYKNAKDNGYDNWTEKRFSILNGYTFGSVLDVGSGPCLLKTWLENKDKDEIKARHAEACAKYQRKMREQTTSSKIKT